MRLDPGHAAPPGLRSVAAERFNLVLRDRQTNCLVAYASAASNDKRGAFAVTGVVELACAPSISAASVQKVELGVLVVPWHEGFQERTLSLAMDHC